jgi:hypothetical protein
MNEKDDGELCVRCREQPSSEVMDGLPTCARCADLIRRKSKEPRSCPVDGTELRRDVVQNIILNRCPDCGGIWLDHDELEALLRIASEHTDEGFMNAVLLGLAW